MNAWARHLIPKLQAMGAKSRCRHRRLIRALGTNEVRDYYLETCSTCTHRTAQYMQGRVLSHIGHTIDTRPSSHKITPTRKHPVEGKIPPDLPRSTYTNQQTSHITHRMLPRGHDSPGLENITYFYCATVMAVSPYPGRPMPYTRSPLSLEPL